MMPECFVFSSGSSSDEVEVSQALAAQANLELQYGFDWARIENLHDSDWVAHTDPMTNRMWFSLTGTGVWKWATWVQYTYKRCFLIHICLHSSALSSNELSLCAFPPRVPLISVRIDVFIILLRRAGIMT
jgi:hypothetical protein